MGGVACIDLVGLLSSHSSGIESPSLVLPQPPCLSFYHTSILYGIEWWLQAGLFPLAHEQLKDQDAV